jgi:hypothetical protein
VGSAIDFDVPLAGYDGSLLPDTVGGHVCDVCVIGASLGVPVINDVDTMMGDTTVILKLVSVLTV